MNKKQAIVLSLISALIISGFGIANVMASETIKPSSVQVFQNRFGITLTDEQKSQIKQKEAEMEKNRTEEINKWKNMDINTWKTEQINKINATTEEDFNKIKERMINSSGKGKKMMIGRGFNR